MNNAEHAKDRDAIEALIAEVAPPPLVVSETAIRQLTPLLRELIRRRMESMGNGDHIGEQHKMVKEEVCDDK